MQTNLQLLRGARALIEDSANWTQGAAARDDWGEIVCATDSTAKSFCAYGAVDSVARNHQHCWATAEGLMDRLDEASETLYGLPASDVNDQLGHAAILQVFDLAIANLKKETQNA